ncbi:hypothetical protein PSN45_000121 [Yamadazyma tenuis]|uniref:uncharacterized protein n=1 Tax=Candida tenuis TaxID=2315449 RepID=UPI0027A9B7EB|nr:hypothetical protein PSN45_000121 [Yamadazyma tenuis]
MDEKDQYSKDSLKEYWDTQLVKDLKLCGAVMISVLLVLFHYVYVMKKLLDNPEMSYGELALNFGIWATTAAGIIYGFIYKVHPLLSQSIVPSDKKND